MQSFAIEAPGESNPLNETALLHTLESASSNNLQQIQTGTKQLQHWEKAPGYYKHLQSVFIHRQLPFEVRYLAIIQLKNGIDKYWRKTATNAVNKDDKAVIRSRLVESGVEEQDHRLALQNALVVAKIVRFEYPNDWPDAINSITDALRSSTLPDANPIHLPRTLLVLLHVVKELATGRLARTRQSLQSATPEIIQVVGQIYAENVRLWQNSLQAGTISDLTSVRAVETSLLAIKTLRRLFIAGYEFPNRESDVHQFWQLSSHHVGSFIDTIRNQSASLPSDVTQSLEKHLLQLSKFHLEMATTHPAAFVLLPGSVDLVRSYWSLVKQLGEVYGSKTAVTSSVTAINGDQSDEKNALEKLCLKGMLLVRACIKMVFNPSRTFKYRQPQEKEEQTQAITTIKEQLLTQGFIQELMEVVVIKFFVFRESDLREWEEEPEEWEHSMEGEGEGFEYSIRPCAEKLFLDLSINFKDLLIQPLLGVFHSVATPENDNILFKDSVYTAIGLAAPVLHQQLDFNTFLTSTLMEEVQKQAPGYNILRRRIAIIIGQWISVQISEENRPLVYTIFQHLLDTTDTCNDQVVRVTAGRQFMKIVDDWEFKAEQFLPYAETTMARLMRLIEEVELTETKMALLNSISVTVERLEHHIAPFAEQIVTLLPPLWEQSGDEHLMKQAILTILTRLVNAMKSASVPMHPVVIPIIKGAVEPGSDTQLYLLDDALDLWAAILVQSPAPISSDLTSLAPYLLSIYELESENFRRALEISQSYVLLAPNDMLADSMRKPVFSALASVIGNLKPEANGLVNNLIEMMIRSAENLGGEEAVGTVVSDLVECGFLGQQLRGLHGSWIAHCTTGPLAKDPPVDGIVETDYFSVLARIAIGSASVFMQAIQVAAPAPDSGNSVETTMKWLLEEWFSHFENIGDPSRRKLMCLALTKLLSTSQPFILSSLQSLMTVWTDVVTELRDDGDAPDADSLVFDSQDGLEGRDPAIPEAPEDERRRALTCGDPVHTVKVAQWIRHYLQVAMESAGGQEAFQKEWLVNVDKDVVAAFGGLGIM